MESSATCDKSNSQSDEKASDNDGPQAEVSSSNSRPLSPPPPPPLPDADLGEPQMDNKAILKDDSSSSNNNNNSGEGDNQSVSLLVPRHFGGLTSGISSLNSSFRTYDVDMDIRLDPDDIRNLELVEDDDDDDDDTQTASTVAEMREPLRVPVSLRGEGSLSPVRIPRKPHQRTPIPKTTAAASAPTSLLDSTPNNPNIPNNLHRAQENNANNKKHHLLDDSLQFPNNAHHERQGDKIPVWPSRGASICTEDSERIKAALNKQYSSQHMSSSGSDNNNNNKLQHSDNSSFPSMWEESWSTFATLENSQHRPAGVILEVDNEDHDESLYSPPPPPPPLATTPRKNSNGPNIANQRLSSVFQQMSMQQRSLLGEATANSNSNNKRSSMMSNTAPPRRTSSRNSQYSSYSDSMSRSTMDASQVKRVSRNERISRLKRKSLKTPQQGSAGSLSPTQTFSKRNSISIDSFTSSSVSNSSASHNSQKPERRPTKVLPHDEEAEAEPQSFFQHSESQLSLTSSEEEDEEYADESDMTPRLPVRRGSVSSMTLYEAEAATIRMNTALDQPLSAPLRRTSTWGSTDYNTANLEPHPETVQEEDDEESEDGNDNGDDDDDEEEESIVQLVLSEDTSYHLTASSLHLMEDNSNSVNLPVSSVHVQEMQDDSDQNLTMSSAHREMPDDSDQTLPSSIHLPPPLPSDENDQNPGIEQDHVPSLPSRQRSIPRGVVARSKQEWLKKASSATTDDLPHVRRPKGKGGSPEPDFTPSKPKRQSTLTKEDLYDRLLGDAKAGLGKNDDESENKENSVQSPSVSLSSQKSNTSDGRRVSTPGPGHRRSLSSEAPNPPMRQVSKNSTIMSPALGALDSLSLHESKEFLLLSNREQDLLQESLSSHAGDFEFGFQPPPLSSLQQVGITKHTKSLTNNDDEAFHGSRGDLTDTSLSLDLHPVRPREELQFSKELQNSNVSAATTHCASNIASQGQAAHIVGGRVLPVRRNTRGSSLRSAAASLQQRESMSSLHSLDETNSKQGGESPKPKSTNSAATLTLTPSDEFEELKKLNECTMQGLNEQLDSLQVMNDVAAAESGSAGVDSAVTNAQAVGTLKTDDCQIGASEHSINGGGAEGKERPATATELNLYLDAFGGSHNSTGSMWTSASKEFEHLKLMNDDTFADLETQLQMLEQQEAEHNDNSSHDFD